MMLSNNKEINYQDMSSLTFFSAGYNILKLHTNPSFTIMIPAEFSNSSQ